jgi:Ca2+-transporting ATPase
MRSERASLASIGILSNRAQVAAGLLGLCFIAAISYVPVLQSVFNTAALAAGDWILVGAFGVLALIADETRKAWHRSRDHQQKGAT